MPRQSIHDAKYRQLLARLRRAREDAGMPQVDVSRRLRKPPNYCNRIETGERRLQVMDLADLANLYKRPLRYFLPDTPSDGA